jgi:hypothetical protein
MISEQGEAPQFALRDLTRGETIVAFLGMAHMLKQALMHMDPSLDLQSFKQDLIRQAKNGVMRGSSIRDEIAVIDTIVDLIEIAYVRAEKAKASDPRRIVPPSAS